MCKAADTEDGKGTRAASEQVSIRTQAVTVRSPCNIFVSFMDRHITVFKFYVTSEPMNVYNPHHEAQDIVLHST